MSATRSAELVSPAGSCVWHVVGLQRSIREWAMRQGWGGKPVRVEQAQVVAALGGAGGVLWLWLTLNCGDSEKPSRGTASAEEPTEWALHSRAELGENRVQQPQV